MFYLFVTLIFYSYYITDSIPLDYYLKTIIITNNSDAKTWRKSRRYLRQSLVNPSPLSQRWGVKKKLKIYETRKLFRRFCHKILNFITISRNMHQNSIRNNFSCNFNNSYRKILFFTFSSRNSMKIKSKSNAENNLVFSNAIFILHILPLKAN